MLQKAGNPRYEVDGNEVEKGKKKRNKKRERERGRDEPLRSRATIATLGKIHHRRDE